jgi:transcription antitermination protein NusB
MHSRRKSREFLLQSLYSRVTRGWDFDRSAFLETYFSGENGLDLETAYIDLIEKEVLAHESELLSMIATLAPKFELPTLPTLHILIIMIALTEMLYAPSLDIPRAVSVNEAIELAKKFSDDGGREFINGALSTFLREKETGKLETKETHFYLFSALSSRT